MFPITSSVYPSLAPVEGFVGQSIIAIRMAIVFSRPLQWLALSLTNQTDCQLILKPGLLSGCSAGDGFSNTYGGCWTTQAQ